MLVLNCILGTRESQFIILCVRVCVCFFLDSLLLSVSKCFFRFLRSLAVCVCHGLRLLESHVRKCFSNLRIFRFQKLRQT